MILSELIYPTVISACGVVLIAAFAIIRNTQNRKKVKENLYRDLVTYPTASAGTPTRVVPAEQESIPTKYTQFKDYRGNIINPDDYFKFVVKGDSMQFCGIHNDDLIFVRKDFELQDLKSFPTPVVIKRDNAPANETQYKVRRAWGVCTIDTCEDMVANILSSDDFRNKIATLSFFDGSEAMKEDFRETRLRKYCERYFSTTVGNTDKSSEDSYKNIIVSTTFHTDENKIRFSIHPASDVIGSVSDSFTI